MFSTLIDCETLLQHLDDPAVLLYFHGGGFAIGSPKSHDTVNRHIAAYAGVQVISVDYRMAPENPFPAAIEDAMAAYDHVREHASAFGIAPDRIAVSGDSATARDGTGNPDAAAA